MQNSPITVQMSQESRDALAQAAKDKHLTEDGVVELALDAWMAEIIKRCTKANELNKSGRNLSSKS